MHCSKQRPSITSSVVVKGVCGTVTPTTVTALEQRGAEV